MNEAVKHYGSIGAGILVIVLIVWSVWGAISGDDVAKAANTITHICAETGETFDIELKPDMPGVPRPNPKTGRNTLYPAEICYWNECGPKGGTPVLMNTYAGREEPTYCPVCGHIVRFRNPRPPSSQAPEE